MLEEIREINSTLEKLKNDVFGDFSAGIDTILPTSKLDELSSKFEDVQKLAQDAYDQGLVTQDVVDNIKEINNNFVSVKGEEDLVLY